MEGLGCYSKIKKEMKKKKNENSKDYYGRIGKVYQIVYQVIMW